MLKDVQDSFKEWLPAVPGRWYSMLQNVVLPLIPLIGGAVYAIRQSIRGLPVPSWDWILMIAMAGIFVVLSFQAFHRMRLARDKIISESNQQQLRRQERKERRQRFSGRVEIPPLLSKMYECAKMLCTANKKPLTSQYWKQIADTFFGAHQAPTVAVSLDKMPSAREVIDMINSTPNPLDIAFVSTSNPAGTTDPIEGLKKTVENFKRLILNVQATMSFHNMGAIPLTSSNDEYNEYFRQVKLLQNNLPNEINRKIQECIWLSNGLANLLCVDFSTTEAPISGELHIVIQSILPSMDNWAQRLRDEIYTMIEAFLLGD